MSDSIHDFKVQSADGAERALADFRGKTVLVVNTASKCGLTPQYEGLQKLHERFAPRGFEVLAFPANDFMWQEPGSNAEIQEFCSEKYGVTFPVFAKIHVKGKEIAPLYRWLTEESGHDGDIEWNFAKFLIGPDGKVIERFHPKVDPLAPEVIERVEAALA